MNNQLARRVLLKTSPTYASKYTAEILTGWFADIAARPDDYRAVIQTTPSEQHAPLNRMLDLFIQMADKGFDIHTPPADLESEFFALLPETNIKPLLPLYFVGDLVAEFVAGAETVKANSNE